MRVYGGDEHWTIMAAMTSSYLVSVRPGCLERVQLPPCMEQDASDFCSFPSLSVLSYLCLCVCICMCTSVDVDARSQPLVSFLRMPSALFFEPEFLHFIRNS